MKLVNHLQVSPVNITCKSHSDFIGQSQHKLTKAHNFFKKVRCVEPRIIFTSRKILPIIYKDNLSLLQQSMVVYQYLCRCDCRYVGRTSQKLKDRIHQHIPRCIRSDKRLTKNLRSRECKITNTLIVYCDSTIGQHLLENEECAKHYNNAQFSILASARSLFHLSVLESTYINSLQPILCRQKEFVYSLQISH